MLADGMEAILDAYVYLHKAEEEKPDWLAFCIKTMGVWLVKVQNEGRQLLPGLYRRFHTYGFQVQHAQRHPFSGTALSGDRQKYKAAAEKAGDWSFDNAYLNMESGYRGTCDNTDIQDKEAGICFVRLSVTL